MINRVARSSFQRSTRRYLPPAPRNYKGNLLRTYLSNRESCFHTRATVLLALLATTTERSTSWTCGLTSVWKQLWSRATCFFQWPSERFHAIIYALRISHEFPQGRNFIYQEINKGQYVGGDVWKIWRRTHVLCFVFKRVSIKSSTISGENVPLEEEALLLTSLSLMLILAHTHLSRSYTRTFIQKYTKLYMCTWVCLCVSRYMVSIRSTVDAFSRRAGERFSSLPAARSPRCERRKGSFTFRGEIAIFLPREDTPSKINPSPGASRIVATRGDILSRSHTTAGERIKRIYMYILSRRRGRPRRSSDSRRTRAKRSGKRWRIPFSRTSTNAFLRPLINELPSPSTCLFNWSNDFQFTGFNGRVSGPEASAGQEPVTRTRDRVQRERGSARPDDAQSIRNPGGFEDER